MSEGYQVNQLTDFAITIGTRTFSFTNDRNMNLAAIINELNVELQKGLRI